MAKHGVYGLPDDPPVRVAIASGGGSGGTASTIGDDFPETATAAGFPDSAGDMRGARVYDADSGAGQEQVLGVQLRQSGPGASVEAGTAANPIRNDPTGTTVQPAAIADGSNSSVRATVLDLPNANPLAVRLTDSNGDYVAAGAGSQYADGAAQATPNGTVAMGHDGSNVRAVTTDADGDLQVDVKSSALPTGASTAARQDTGNSSLSAIETSVGVLDDWDESDRAKVNLVAGQAGVAAGAGAVTANTQRMTHASDDPLFARLGEVQASPTANTLLARLKDLLTGIVLAAGANAIGKLAPNSGVDIGDVDVTSLPGSAHDAVVAGAPVRVGGKSLVWGAAVTPVSADGDTVDLIATRSGILYTASYAPNSWSIPTATYASAQTNTSLKTAPGAGLSLYITDVVISNGATAGIIKLLDGSGGTELVGGHFAVNGGLAISFRTPIKLTANTALCVTSTDVTSHKITVQGFTAA